MFLSNDTVAFCLVMTPERESAFICKQKTTRGTVLLNEIFLYSDLTGRGLSTAIFNLNVENKSVQLALQTVLAIFSGRTSVSLCCLTTTPFILRSH